MKAWAAAVVLLGGCDVGGFNPLASEPEPQEAAAGDPVSTDALDRFVGDYDFAGGEQQRTAWREAIEDLVQSLNALMRGMARDKIIETNPVYDHVSIQRSGDQVTLRFDGLTHVCKLDGSGTTVKGHDGSNVTCTLQMKGDALLHKIRGSRGGRDNTITRDDNGRLKLKVRIHSKLMPKDLNYTLSFKAS